MSLSTEDNYEEMIKARGWSILEEGQNGNFKTVIIEKDDVRLTGQGNDRLNALKAAFTHTHSA